MDDITVIVLDVLNAVQDIIDKARRANKDIDMKVLKSEIIKAIGNNLAER